MEIKTKLKILCFICQSRVNSESSQSSVEICKKFQIYSKKFFSPSASGSNSDGGEIDKPKNKVSCCDHCVTKVETICDLWESFESLQGEMIRVLVKISKLTKLQSHPEKVIIQQRGQKPKGCFICQAAPRLTPNSSGKSSKIETCSKFVTFVKRFVLNTENPSFGKKTFQVFLEMGDIKNFVRVYCCDICLNELVTFNQMYEALDSLRLEILRILHRISNRSTRKYLLSLFENYRKQTFPRVNLERLPWLDRKSEQVQVEAENNPANRELTEVADFDFESDLQAESELQLDDEFESIEMASNGIPSPSWSLHDNSTVDENAYTTELSPANPVNIFQTSPMTMNTTKCKTRHFEVETASNENPSPSSSLHINNIDQIVDMSESAPTKPVNFLQFFHLKTKLTKRETEQKNLSRIGKRKFPGSGYKGACLFCEKKFRAPCLMESHMRSHTGERGFICRICLQEFSQKPILLSHRRSRHFREKTAPAPKICDHCGKSFESKHRLDAHVQAVHEKLKPHKCEICGKSFFSTRHVKLHQRAVHEEKPSIKEVCHICGRTVSVHKNSLQRHLNDYHRSEIDDSLKLEKKFKCSVADCSKAFYDRHKLQRHIMTHTGEKNFQCDECGKSFSIPFKLKIHKEIHKEVRPHVCAHCGKGFNYRHRLKQHEKKYHSSDNNVNSDGVIESSIYIG